MPRNLGQVTHTILRFAAGVLFLQHGVQKILGLLGGFQGGTVPLISAMGVAGMLEFIGGELLILGLFTRPVAAVLTLEMIVAYIVAHFPQGGWPIQNGGELALLYASIFLFFVGNGAGAFSLDSMMPLMNAYDRRHVPERRARLAA